MYVGVIQGIAGLVFLNILIFLLIHSIISSTP